MRRCATLFVFCLLLAAASPFAARTAASPRVVSFTPEGLAKGVRQVVARFDADMIPLGDPRVAADAFQVDCGEPGRARWVTAREWVYEFARDLPAGIRCRFVMKPGLTAVGGARVGGRPSFSFHTGGPAILQIHPYPGSTSVAEDQRFVVRVDALPDPGSVERFVRIHAGGLSEPIAVRQVEGADRERSIRAHWGREPDELDLILEPVLRLPSDTAIELVWDAGIATRGVATVEAQRYAYKTWSPLTLEIHCERERPEAGCIPLRPITLRFSQPVGIEAVGRARLVPIAATGSAVAAGAPIPLRFVSTNARDRSEHGGSFQSQGEFVPKTRYRLELPPEIRDELGRALQSIDPARLVVEVASMPPLAKFSGEFGILEAADPVLPVAVRGLESDVQPKTVSIRSAARTAALATPSASQIWGWLRAATDDPRSRDRDELGVDRAPGDRSIFERAAKRGQTVAAPIPLALPRTAGRDSSEAELIGIPLTGLGLHAVDIESSVLGEALTGSGQTYHASALALVTNLSIHFKLGRQGSLAWVTTLDEAAPVEGARVAVFDCRGSELAAGTSDEDGIVRLTGLPEDLETHDDEKDCAWGDYQRGLLVRAESGGDVSFVHTSWDRGIEPWRFDLPIGWSVPAPVGHTVLDRSLFRAGETVHMKHVLREPVLAGLALPSEGKRPKQLRVVHAGSGDIVEAPIELAADGTAIGEWTIPATAKLGTYQIQLVIGEQALETGSFRVEAYRLPLLRGKLQGPKRPALAGRPIPLDFALTYLSGGPASRLPVELRSELRPFAVATIDGFEEYRFLRGDLKSGLERWESRFGGDSPETPRAAPPAAKSFELDETGGLHTQLDATPASDEPRQVAAEMSFRDPNGELQTIARTIPVYPSERLIGLRLDPHRNEGDPLRMDVALLDLEQKPVRGRVKLDLFERKVYSHRKRLVGGFYAYEHTSETTALGALCEGRTDRAGKYACSAPLAATGQLFVRATAVDDEGRQSATHEDLWVPGPDDYWYEATDSDRMDLVPEKKRVEPGETARIRVRMPFRKATALVTVEREGVAEAFVTRLSGRDPRVKLKILDAHAPNIFVSVVAVRGRVDAPAPTARVDLARPASKLGVTELAVGLVPRTLVVQVTPERDTYSVRERVRARVRVRTAEGRRPPAGTELALAVVDEALLELSGNESWNLLEAMHGRRSYDVRSFSAQLQIVGKRHFGLKARPAGGGGGASATRELFDTLLDWQPRVRLDEQGEAVVEFSLNDSLSAFRIAAIASGGIDRFGTGYGRFRTTQDLMMLPGVAPVARDGDRMRPEFTVRNASEKAMQVESTLVVEGLAQTFEPVALALAPGQAKTVAWEVEVPTGVDSLAWEASARAETGASDRVKTVQRVSAAVPERIFMAELVQLGAETTTVAVEASGDAIPGRGGIDVRLRASLANGTDGIDRFLREYPYSCLEQKASTAIGRRDLGAWQSLMAELPGYLDEQGLARFWPTDRLQGSDVLTAYLISIASEAGWEIPAATLERMVSGLEAYVAGGITRPSWRRVADLPLRRLAALEALSRHGRVKPEQLATLPAQVELWPTSALLDGLSLVGRLPIAPATTALRRRVEQALAARLTVGGTTVGFSTESGDALDWLLATGETNLNRFMLLAHGSSRFDRELPRLMKGTIGRQRGGSWSTTIANAWGRLALERHAARFEKEPVTGMTRVALGAASEEIAWSEGRAEPGNRIPWPARAAHLDARHDGTGRPWAEIQTVAAIPLRAPLFAGYAIERTWTPVVQKTPGVYSRGDIVRVGVVVDAQSDASWVVVDDPIPAGATILGSGLGRDSALLRVGESAGALGWGCPCIAYRERTELAHRDYYEFLPKGRVEIEYTLRLNQDGLFQLPPTRVEAMYAPESFGELPHEALRIEP